MHISFVNVNDLQDAVTINFTAIYQLTYKNIQVMFTIINATNNFKIVNV